MSSPITFSGFNNIDFNVVLNALMQQASQPLTVLQSQQTALKSQVTTFKSLTSHVATLASAVAALADADGLNGHSGTSSQPTALGVSVGPGAVAGHYDVVVNELARAQVTASTSSAADSDTTVVASGGSITIGGVSVTISGDVTLQGLAAAINGTDGIGVNAAVIRTAADTYRLVLTSRESGLAGAFTIGNNLTGGAGVTFAGNAVEASDASLLVNNIPVTGSSNTFTDVIPGVTLTALQKDAATTIAVDVAADSSALEAKLQSFVDAYNGLVQFLGEQREAAGRNEASSIGRDPLLRQLRNALRTDILGAHGTGTFTRLSEVGIEFTRTGQLQLDKAKLADAIELDADAVRAMFGGAGGAFTTIESDLEQYTQTSGFIDNATGRLDDQIDRMDQQIANMQSRLAIQREALLREFVEADSLMARLRNQSGSLANFGAGLGPV
ncbi:MAG TPA: flagellar filament capping protein FliD [Vicinamibacterales bacterium]|nr:flagellar filament capping protein FliD [Vicinamibacterales bacterium]